MDGYNVCICAYGQTGTGKTHTILGAPGAPGLAPRTFTRLFELAREAEARCDVRVSAYVLELYNDRLIDLLKPPDNGRDSVSNNLFLCVNIPTEKYISSMLFFSIFIYLYSTPMNKILSKLLYFQSCQLILS